ncbi:MAG TPA: hypothetical protein VJG83_01900 [archaeon]|nr:hypothetical protein [archaeon]
MSLFSIRMLFNAAFAIVNLCLIILLYSNPLLLAVLLALISIVALYFWKSKTTIILFALGAVIGTFGETIAINSGAWQYAYTNIANIPFWVILIWGNIVAFSYQAGNDIAKEFKFES